MSAALAFLGTFLLSLFVALLAALQLADYFAAGAEFALVLTALPVFVLFSMVVLGIAYAAARRPGVFTAVAVALALLALVPPALPKLVLFYIDRSSNPLSFRAADVPIVLELLVPALLAVLVQWGLMRRRWLRLRGEDDLTRWPWVTTILAGLVVLNPFGLDVLGQVVASRQAVWMRDVFRTVALCGIGALIAMTLIEYYIRGRMLRRRSAAGS